MFTGVLVGRKVAAGGGMILEGDPSKWLAKIVFEEFPVTHVFRISICIYNEIFIIGGD